MNNLNIVLLPQIHMRESKEFNFKNGDKEPSIESDGNLRAGSIRSSIKKTKIDIRASLNGKDTGEEMINKQAVKRTLVFSERSKRSP